MFTTDSRTETFLTQMGVPYQYTNNVSFGSLRGGWESRNIARPTPQRQNAILEYALLMEQGSPAPAVILHKTEQGLDVLDGVQRLSAAEMSATTVISAYVVTCDSDNLVTAIRLLANARLQGHQESPEWTKRQAVQHLVIQRCMTCTEVAKMGGWREADVRRLSEVMNFGFKLRCIGAPQNLPDVLVQSIREKIGINNIHKAQQPVVEFLVASQRANFATADLEPYLSDFFAPYPGHNWHEEFNVRLQNFLSSEEVQVRLHGRKGQPLTHDVNLRRAMRSVITVMDGIAESGDKLSYVEEFQQLANTITKKLKTLKK
jgi:hypothetical protein